MRISDTPKFKRDIVHLTRTYRSTYAALLMSSFRATRNTNEPLTPLEIESLSNVVTTGGFEPLPHADMFFVGRNVIQEYLNRALGPEPIQLGAVYPYTQSGIVVFEQPLVLSPDMVMKAIEQRKNGNKADAWDEDAVKVVPISAVSWNVCPVPTASDDRKAMNPKPGIVVMLWTHTEDIRKAFEEVTGDKLDKAFFPIYPLSYASAAFGGWFIAESGLVHPDAEASIYYDGDTPESAAEATAVTLVHHLWAMLEEHIFVASRQGFSKKYDKMFRRMNLKMTDVSVIQLRQVEYTDRNYDPDAHHLVDWSHRWEVRGHYRRITDRRTGEERLVWVRAHIKGPEGKPLRETEKINALTR